MSDTRPLPFLVLLLFATCVTLSCGSSNSRQLQSITITAGTSNGGDVSFVATGNYNKPPLTITPLAASWFLSDPPGGYQLTTQPYTVPCLTLSPMVFAMAPADPHAPSTGPVIGTKMVQGSAAITC